jgi:hypothetical protein
VPAGGHVPDDHDAADASPYQQPHEPDVHEFPLSCSSNGGRRLGRIFDALNVELGGSKTGSHGRDRKHTVAIGARSYDGRDQFGQYLVSHCAFAVRSLPQLL